jgi:hypothetical protein
MRRCHMKQTEHYDNPAEAQARFQVYRLRRFYQKLIMYVIITMFLFTINYFTSPDYWWAWWPALGMGIAILIRGTRVLGWNFLWNDQWEDRKVAEILAKKDK